MADFGGLHLVQLALQSSLTFRPTTRSETDHAAIRSSVPVFGFVHSYTYSLLHI